MSRKYIKELLGRFQLVDGLFRRFIWSRIHFSEVEMRFLSSLGYGVVDVAIDVGAAMGAYSWILNRVSRQVYSFEPGKVHNEYLNRVAFWTRINVIRAAVGSVCGKVNMYTPGADSNARHSATLSVKNPVINVGNTIVDEVEQVTLDSFFEGKILEGRVVDVLKVDVEGYELEVFRGAAGLIEKYHPMIICEIEARHNVAYRDVFEFLKKRGYGCYIFQSGSFERFVSESIEEIQLGDDLKVCMGPNYNPYLNRYINNFVFQHPKSRIKVVK